MITIKHAGHFSASRTIVAIVSALMLCLCLAACASQTDPSQDTPASSDNAAVQSSTTDTASADGMFVSDEQCMSCHGGSYEAVAQLTESYGLSNPHDSSHGGYNSCVNCHAKDKEISDNKCENCHSWPHNPVEGPLASASANES